MCCGSAVIETGNGAQPGTVFKNVYVVINKLPTVKPGSQSLLMNLTKHNIFELLNEAVKWTVCQV